MTSLHSDATAALSAIAVLRAAYVHHLIEQRKRTRPPLAAFCAGAIGASASIPQVRAATTPSPLPSIRSPSPPPIKRRRHRSPSPQPPAYEPLTDAKTEVVAVVDVFVPDSQPDSAPAIEAAIASATAADAAAVATVPESPIKFEPSPSPPVSAIVVINSPRLIRPQIGQHIMFDSCHSMAYDTYCHTKFADDAPLGYFLVASDPLTPSSRSAWSIYVPVRRPLPSHQRRSRSVMAHPLPMSWRVDGEEVADWPLKVNKSSSRVKLDRRSIQLWLPSLPLMRQRWVAFLWYVVLEWHHDCAISSAMNKPDGTHMSGVYRAPDAMLSEPADLAALLTPPGL